MSGRGHQPGSETAHLPPTARHGSFIAAIRPPVGNYFGAAAHPGNFDPVGGRTLARRKLAISSRREIGTLVLVLVAGLAPALGVMIGIAATLQPDLSNLSPVHGADPALLNWSGLLREDHSTPPNPGAGVEVRALGYMMEGKRAAAEGQWVREFYLLPDAGNLFHPAHRDGDQMIAVHLADGARVRFSSRALVWVWGSLQWLPGDAEGAKPLYTLERARVQAAEKGEIRRYFR